MKEYQINSEKNKKTKALDISIEGQLNVSNISAIHKELNKLIKKNKKINIELTDVEDADISIIQLLVSLQNKSKQAGIDINMQYDLNTEITELFSRAGFSNTIIN